MSTLNSPRGTRDILPAQYATWQKVEQIARETMNLCGFQPIRTPIYEDIGLFERSIGAGTDVIDKELFLVKGKHSDEDSQYALRPEGTAGIVRAYIQHGMQTLPQPVKVYGIVNNFRYERPQKGRYREHWQLTIEYLGEKGPFADAWVIFTSWMVFQKLGMQEIHLKINTLGTLEERTKYLQALQDYLRPLHDQLSTDSQKRLEVNPLRILDSKDEQDQSLLKNAPTLDSFLGEVSQSHFAEVKKYLDSWGIAYVRDTHLVRGLDYYSHTTFEWVSTHLQGSQNSIGGGGRYDGLLTQLGGPNNGAVGVGIGLDRVVEELETLELTGTPNKPQIVIIAADPTGKITAARLLQELVQASLSCEANLDKDSLGSQLKYAGKSGAQWAVIIGQTESENAMVIVKNLNTGQQEEIEQSGLVAYLKNAN